MHPAAAFFWENSKDILRLGITFPSRYAKMLFSDFYSVSVRGIGPIHIRKKSMDLWVLRQVFRTRQYEIWCHPLADRIGKRYQQILDQGKIPLIIDAGANNGCSSLWFAKKFPRSKVAAIEPGHENCEICRINTKENSGITVIEAAIGGAPGFVTLDNPDHKSWNVVTTRSDKKDETRKTVEVRTVNEIVSTFGSNYQLFIAKIDIEGFEHDLFNHNTDWLGSVMAVIIELHDWMLPGQFSSSPYPARDCKV
jgi:FkbM family methyltransferase